MASTATRTRRTLNVWPGYVDALATLLLSVVFLLTVFVVGQFFLSQELTGRDETLAKTNRQIAAAMYLAEKTVKNYVSNLLAKLGMERRTQAATFAARLEERSTQSELRDATGT